MCRRARPLFERAVAYGSYDGALRELIHLLKYQQVRPAAKVLGGMLAEAVAKLEPTFAGPGLIVPVPLHARKERQRGFNQSEMVARVAAKAMGSKGLTLAPEALTRVRETKSQIGLTSHQRREIIRGAFAVPRPERIAGRTILLVDDVYTTGTTVGECSRMLRRAGASKIYVATVARTLKLGAVRLEMMAPETEEENGHFLHAARIAMRLPSVIRLLEYRRIPHQTRAL